MRIIYVVILLVVALVLYLSWIPDPKLVKVNFIPNWISRWADEEIFEDIRTGVPLLLLGFFVGLLPIVGPSENISRWFITWLLLTALVILAELGQLFLPKRAFSLADIGWGSGGALLGLTLAAIAKDNIPRFFKPVKKV